jgi:hypothetical protein
MAPPIQPRKVDNQTIAELHYKDACKYATTAALTVTVSSGNQILTNAGAQATFSPDGTNVVLGDRILIKDQSDTKQNGIYKVTNIGSGSTNWILERALHFNSSTECVSGAVYFTIVSGGTTNKHKNFFIGVGTEAATTTFGTTTFSVSASGAASEITVADESTDTECFPVFTTAATGNLAPKSGSNLTFNSSTGVLTATKISGSLNMSDAGAGTLALNRGGTGSTTASGARTNLGLGTMATENVAALTNSIVPNTTNSIDLGSASKTFRDLYLSGSTLNLGNIKLQDNSGELIVKNSSDHQLHHTDILKHIIHDPSSQTTITLNSSSWNCIQNFKTSFTTPAGCTEVMVEAGVFFYPGSNTGLGLALSSNSSGTSYTEWSSANGGRNTERQIYYTYYSSRANVTKQWHLTGLTAGTEYDINLAFKRWTGTNTAYVMIGGSTYPKGFLKVRYLHNGFDTDAESGGGGY